MINICLKAASWYRVNHQNRKKIVILTFDTNLRTHRNLILLACPVLWNWSYYKSSMHVQCADNEWLTEDQTGFLNLGLNQSIMILNHGITNSCFF